MKINEIFYSLQGEGRLTGLPTIFIRTTGCNLRCSYCDTKSAYHHGTDQSIEEILEATSSYDCKTVCLTGGEPMQQKETLNLLDELIAQGYSCSIETNGSYCIQPLLSKPMLLISLDMKTPSSQMDSQMKIENIKLLRSQDQLKFVIETRKDYLFAKQIIESNKTKAPIYFQPVWESKVTTLASWILSDHLPVRLGLQLHKILWGGTTDR